MNFSYGLMSYHHVVITILNTIQHITSNETFKFKAVKHPIFVIVDHLLFVEFSLSPTVLSKYNETGSNKSKKGDDPQHLSPHPLVDNTS